MYLGRVKFICLCLVLIGFHAWAANEEVRQLARLQSSSLKESSGLVASRTQPGVLWTHNDGGGRKRQVLYAVDRSGRELASFRLAGLRLSDWEDLAVDNQGRLYLGDLGNNDRRRDRLYVYRVEEPRVSARSGVLQPEARWELLFSGEPFDCESLLVTGSYGYVISKVFDDAHAEMHRFALEPAGGTVQLHPVARLPVTSPVTGADLSADGRLLGLVSKKWAYVFEVKGNLLGAAHAPFVRAEAPVKDLEGCTFVSDGLLATAESREIILFSGAAFVP